MNAKLRGFATSCSIVCVVFAGPWARARAAPNDGYAMSNDAALRGGTAVVFGRDVASVWYNPASVAATPRFRFDAAVTAYGLRITRARSALEAEVDDRSVRTPGREDQTQVVPTAAAVAFGWPDRDFALALSFHTPIYSDVETPGGTFERGRLRFRGAEQLAGDRAPTSLRPHARGRGGGTAAIGGHGRRAVRQGPFVHALQRARGLQPARASVRDRHRCRGDLTRARARARVRNAGRAHQARACGWVRTTVVLDRWGGSQHVVSLHVGTGLSF